jgi:hypothetical protein
LCEIAANDPSMLLSFERPASAGDRVFEPKRPAQMAWEPAGVSTSPRSLKTAQKPQSAAIDKRRLITGITGSARTAHRKVLGMGEIRSPSR